MNTCGGIVLALGAREDSAMAIGLLLFLLLTATSCSASASADGLHDILKDYGLPKGVLPHAKRYSLSGDGDLAVELKAPCYVQFSDVVYYDRTITGKITSGVLSGLSGVQVKKLFVWFPVSAIAAHPDSGTVELKVSLFSFSYPAAEFKHIPRCMKVATIADADELLPVSQV